MFCFCLTHTGLTSYEQRVAVCCIGLVLFAYFLKSFWTINVLSKTRFTDQIPVKRTLKILIESTPNKMYTHELGQKSGSDTTTCGPSSLHQVSSLIFNWVYVTTCTTTYLYFVSRFTLGWRMSYYLHSAHHTHYTFIIIFDPSYPCMCPLYTIYVHNIAQSKSQPKRFSLNHYFTSMDKDD